MSALSDTLLSQSSEFQDFLSACECGQTERVLQFVLNGVDINRMGKDNMTAVQICQASNHLDTAIELLKNGQCSCISDWVDLCPVFAAPTQSSCPRILVLGAGVTGLTTALCLKRAGYDVVIVAEKFDSQLVSVIAGALWEWPPAVCGHHLDHESLVRSKEWTRASHSIFYDLHEYEPTAGVFIRPVVFYFKSAVADRPRDYAKMTELSTEVKDFVHDAGLISEYNVSAKAGVVDAYRHAAPMIDTDMYMKWLMNQVLLTGCRVLKGRATGKLLDNEQSFRKLFGCDVIVNCTGLAAGDLCEDTTYPLRGCLIRVKNDGVSMPKITTAHCVAHEPDSQEQDMVFIVPRGENTLLIGGMTEAHQSDLNINLDNYPAMHQMLMRCREFLPVLENAEIDMSDPIRVGLRPFRERNVRLEIEPTDPTTGESHPIIHNYGHGGSGVTFSWGCSLEVVRMVDSLLKGSSAPLKCSSVGVEHNPSMSSSRDD